MKVITFAAGLAAGYVLGSRAGREKYEQIVAGWQKRSSRPAVVRTQEKATELLASRADTVATKLEEVTPDDGPGAPVGTPRPRSTRRKTASRSTSPAAV